MHKILVYALILCAGLIAIIAPLYAPIAAQDLTIVKKCKEQKQKATKDPSFKMVELKNISPEIIYDLKYGTKDNFTKKKLYPQNTKTYLRAPAANALKNIAQELKTKGYGLKIFDAYRPYSVTKKMWELIKDERYVANPAKGSGHNRGLAVDLSLIDLKTGKELNMGTGFDNFTDTAHHSFMQLSDAVLRNRKLLKEAMIKYGFNPLETEWWHYSWPNNKNYDVLDLSFKELEKLQ